MVSGLEYATLMTAGEPVPLETRLRESLNCILQIYNIPEQIHLNTNPAAQLWRKVMQPIHAGLPSENLYNANAMQSVSICLDSGLKASPACYADARGIQRVVDVLCYAEDIPEGTCDKHVSVHYCVTGGGVAGEYCSLFGDAEVETRSLVKLTRAEIEEIKAAAQSGLVDAYLNPGYVYYVDESGEGLPWNGFYGGTGAEAPYHVCSLHTQDSWQDMEQFPGEDMPWGDGFFDEDSGTGDGFGNEEQIW